VIWSKSSMVWTLSPSSKEKKKHRTRHVGQRWLVWNPFCINFQPKPSPNNLNYLFGTIKVCIHVVVVYIKRLENNWSSYVVRQALNKFLLLPKKKEEKKKNGQILMSLLNPKFSVYFLFLKESYKCERTEDTKIEKKLIILSQN
jgi:hypothetical protein